MTTIAEHIVSYVAQASSGAIVSAKEFLHLGERAAVDQTLSRLVKHGQLLRVGRGLYAAPINTRFGARPPQPSKLIEAIARRTGETVVASGAASANALGLSTQVPAKNVYLTSGPSRQFQLGKQVIELRHAPSWQLRAPKSRVGAAMRALAWLGPRFAQENIAKLRGILSQREQAKLLSLRARMPTWLAQEISALAANS